VIGDQVAERLGGEWLYGHGWAAGEESAKAQS
jgi:hypothetical protein